MRRISHLDDKRMGRICGEYTSPSGELLKYSGFWFLTDKSAVWRIRLTRDHKDYGLLSGTAPLPAIPLQQLVMPGAMRVLIHRGIKAQLEPESKAVAVT